MNEELKKLEEKAQEGDVEAMVIVGDCYNRGIYTHKNDSLAHKFYEMAANQGHAEAAFMIALDYLYGYGVKKDKTLAANYLRKAADKGVANAQYMIGVMYENGEIGIFGTKQKARKYYEKAAKQGHARAQVALGDMNLMNNSSGFSLEKGLFWLLCAYLHAENAKDESKQAMERLNSLIQSGVPGGRERMDNMMKVIKSDYPSYIKNPQ